MKVKAGRACVRLLYLVEEARMKRSGLILLVATCLVVCGALGARQARATTTGNHSARVLSRRAAQLEKKIASLPRAPEGKPLSAPLQPGDIAPDFNLRDQNGKRHRLSDLAGKTVVLEFYPQDETVLCTSQAISYNAALPEFLKRDAIVFGVSVQGIESKKRFAADFGISYPLLADQERTAARAYGVLSEWGTAARVTFIIGPTGRILSTNQNVRAATDATDTLQILDRDGALQSPKLER